MLQGRLELHERTLLKHIWPDDPDLRLNHERPFSAYCLSTLE